MMEPSYKARQVGAALHRLIKICGLLLIAFAIVPSSCAMGQERAAGGRQKIILDTDIGGDIDDAFVLALALTSPEIEILGITTAWGDTQLRARLVDRMLCETGTRNVAVLAGVSSTGKDTGLSQGRWAEAFPKPSKPYPPAVDFIIEQANRYPGQITLVAVAPFTNLGGVIERDAAAFKNIKRIVIMGGSIYRGYGDLGYTPNHGPDPEWNIKADVPAARRMFAAGVPLFVMPLDSTQLKLDEVKRQLMFQQATPLTDALSVLYYEWGQQTPTLFDPVALAYAISPEVCPMKPMHIDVDDQGYTRPGAGAPNAQVCLDSHSDDFFRLFMTRILQQKLDGHCSK
jgi:purine nucleosidase